MAANSRSIVLSHAVFTYSPSTLIVNLHGYHSDPAAAAARPGPLVVKESHAAHSDTLSPKSCSLSEARWGQLFLFCCGSADASQTIVVLLLFVPCAGGTWTIFTPMTQEVFF